MTEEQIALARRAVACKGWRWMPGMATVETPPKKPCITISEWDAARVLSAEQANVTVCTVFRKVRDLHHGALPDLQDPATLGCLLALVREAWGDPAYLWGGHAEVRRDSETLFVVLRFGHDANGFLVERWVSSGTTEAEALVAALEAAP